MEDVLGFAEQSADRVIEFYKKQGTSLSFRPRFRYFDEPCAIPFYVACIRDEPELRRRYAEFTSKELSINIWKDMYGLKVSGDAIEELTNWALERQSRLLPEKYLDPDADILIFQPFREQCAQEMDADELMAHELWHLIEKERHAFESFPFILEGTATYAQKRFRGLSCDRPIEDFQNLLAVLYLGAANVVQNHVGNTDNPYISMLDPQLRASIQDDLLQKIKCYCAEEMRELLAGDEKRKKETAEFIRKIPEFKELEGNLSRESVLGVYRKIGAHKLVSELEGQDLEGLLKLLRLIGF